MRRIPVPLVAAYYRPESVDEALSLLAAPNRIPLGGGTVVNADRAASDVEVVDLQALDLRAIVTDSDRVRVGAMATLHGIATDATIPEQLRSIARAEEPSTLRTLATVGGSIASCCGDSLFLAALLVHDTQVQLAGADDQPLQNLLASGVPASALITGISIDPTGHVAQATTGRTPADVPIVGAVGRSTSDGIALALTGIAPTPLLIDPEDPIAGVTPPDDFRGSSAYRLELAKVLSARVVGALK